MVKKSDKAKGSKRKRVTPAPGRSRGPHPKSPPSKKVLKKLSKLPRHGYITRNPDTGYVYLDVDDEWIFSLSKMMEKFGYETPPYFYGAGATGAHVSLLPAAIGEKYKERDVEVGRKVEFSVTGASPLYPTYRWYGTEALYMVWIESEELDQFIDSFNDPDYDGPGYGKFHIVVGVRSIKTRDEIMKKQ